MRHPPPNVRTRRTTLAQVPPVQVKEAGVRGSGRPRNWSGHDDTRDFEQLEAERLDLGELHSVPPGLRMRLPGACLRLAFPLSGLSRQRRWTRC
jgi:hypothetical protein